MPVPQVINRSSAMQRTVDALRSAGKRIGVVPTMGALHTGHLVLIQEARKHADVVVTTIFVNPKQFGEGEDFERYPRDLESDTRSAGDAGSNFIFAPPTDTMYPAGFSTAIDVGSVSEVLEGRSRPGHFRGVATVVAKLFNITKPHVAVFGQKDAQQVVVIRRLVRDLNFDVELVVVPTVRKSDGLAMSSRNVYLTAEQRGQAPILFQSLTLAGQMIARGERKRDRIVGEMQALIRSRSAASIDYISVADAETLEEQQECLPGRSLLISMAVRFGTTRLIDNTTVTVT
jgi:pantoate--beta-alanine ligase